LVVLDASAALAYLLKEPGERLVRQNLAFSIITSVNLVEVMRRLRRGLSDAQAQTVCSVFVSRVAGVEAVKKEDVLSASRIYADHQQTHGISLGDAVCLAVGLRLGLEVWTTDAIWASLPNAGQVRVIR
jgi:PIN domain nuclease of toxin-antitoxin system